MTEQDKERRDRESGVRQRAIEAYDGARESVAGAGRKAGDAIDEAPLIALAGGLAAGALIAALLPRTESETRMLRPVGDKLTGTARAAAAAAKEAGTSRLAELGLTPEKGRETLRSIFEGAGEAAKTSAQAALDAARTRE
ncbi:MAG TPA: hypothetical protein VFS45_02515 [Sphingomicrobium sp.]|nr:hypothetical protein [Sphingomicrobium sp.]